VSVQESLPGARVPGAGVIIVHGARKCDVDGEADRFWVVFEGDRITAAGDGEVAYTAEAFLCRFMARCAEEEGLALAVRSAGELGVAASTAFPAERIILHGPAKTPEDIRAALDYRVGRVVIENLGHVAEIMREAALKTLLRPGASEVELAQAAEQLAVRSAPALGAVMDDLIRLELRRSFQTDAVTAAERAAGTLPGARIVTVCFADLAGFTRLGEAIRPEDLERIASRFAELAHDAARSPVRFIKSIGDAVMLISFDAVPLLHAVLDLIDAAAENDLPPLRVGVASGLAVSRAGDWFGSPVNVASRVTAEARPGTVMVADSARDAVGNAAGLEWTPAGARRLKGVSDEVKLYRVNRVSV